MKKTQFTLMFMWSALSFSGEVLLAHNSAVVKDCFWSLYNIWVVHGWRIMMGVSLAGHLTFFFIYRHYIEAWSWKIMPLKSGLCLICKEIYLLYLNNIFLPYPKCKEKICLESITICPNLTKTSTLFSSTIHSKGFMFQALVFWSRCSV